MVASIVLPKHLDRHLLARNRRGHSPLPTASVSRILFLDFFWDRLWGPAGHARPLSGSARSTVTPRVRPATTVETSRHNLGFIPHHSKVSRRLTSEPSFVFSFRHRHHAVYRNQQTIQPPHHRTAATITYLHGPESGGT